MKRNPRQSTFTPQLGRHHHAESLTHTESYVKELSGKRT